MLSEGLVNLRNGSKDHGHILQLNLNKFLHKLSVKEGNSKGRSGEVREKFNLYSSEIQRVYAYTFDKLYQTLNYY